MNTHLKLSLSDPTPTPTKTAVTIRALIQRINRRLARENEFLATPRGNRWYSDLGNYYVADRYTGTIAAAHIDPEALGRELGVLGDDETVKR